tara:strand:+ start:77933 stop:78265 length:333 start_codon:yes stop_codon:yes gene_type:complete
MLALPVWKISTLVQLFIEYGHCSFGRLLVVDPEFDRYGTPANMTARCVVFVFYKTIDAVEFKQVPGRGKNRHVLVRVDSLHGLAFVVRGIAPWRFAVEDLAALPAAPQEY